ncbi:MAG: hypothetical protein P4M15_04875 [Alphaproteobacteria bacterium]|nr:hypothetical protein [Alphaproteobacteria bacterium]
MLEPMEILQRKDHREFLSYFPHIKPSLKEWLIIDMRLTEMPDKDFTILRAAEHIRSLFAGKEGKVYLCNDREALMLLHCGKNCAVPEIGRDVTRQLASDKCEATVHEATLEGLTRLAVSIGALGPAAHYFTLRTLRKENVVLVSDDDIYLHMLVRKGVDSQATVHVVSAENNIVEAYKKYVPDILFLGASMLAAQAADIFRDVLSVDPKAYIIVVSVDDAWKHAEAAIKKNAQGLLTAPFTQDRLLGCLRKCPTIS